MSESYSARPEFGGATQPNTVLVWDIFVRVFHWSLVAAFTIAFWSAEELDRLHEWAGYTALALVAARLAWGLVGSRHARFADFIRGPSVTLVYLGHLSRGDEQRYLGHNPVGAVMILAMLAGIGGLGATGYLMTLTGNSEEGVLEEIHEVIANGMLVLIALHVAGVVIAGWRHGENLVAAMITGRKRLE